MGREEGMADGIAMDIRRAESARSTRGTANREVKWSRTGLVNSEGACRSARSIRGLDRSACGLPVARAVVGRRRASRMTARGQGGGPTLRVLLGRRLSQGEEVHIGKLVEISTTFIRTLLYSCLPFLAGPLFDQAGEAIEPRQTRD